LLGVVVIKKKNPAAARPVPLVLSKGPLFQRLRDGPALRSNRSSRRGRHATAIAVLVDRVGSGGRVELVTPPSDDSSSSISSAATAQQQQGQPQRNKTWLLQASLIKSIVGVGALALPAAVATVGGAEAVPFSILLIIVAAAMNAYSFSMLGRVCETTGARSYLEAWEYTVGQDVARSTNVVSVILSLKTALACLAYSMTLADSFHSLVADISRTEALIGITCFALAPLCLLPNLTALAPYSMVGVVGILVTTSFMLLRLLDGTYTRGADDPIVLSTGEDGSIFTMTSIDTGGSAVNALDAWATTGGGLDAVPSNLAVDLATATTSMTTATGVEEEASSVLLLHTDPSDLIGLACTLATAFVCHYNGPRIYNELQGNQRVFQRLTATSFGIGAIIFATIAASGFLTFGTDAAPVILSNYAADDSLMTVSRVLIMASIIATFPLAFLGLRDSLRDKWPWENQWSLTFGLLLGITLVASSFDDLGLLLKLGGGTVSTAVASVIPSLMYLKCWPTATLPKIVCATATVVGITGVTNTLLAL
jgi:amino acid permease